MCKSHDVLVEVFKIPTELLRLSNLLACWLVLQIHQMFYQPRSCNYTERDRMSQSRLRRGCGKTATPVRTSGTNKPLYALNSLDDRRMLSSTYRRKPSARLCLSIPGTLGAGTLVVTLHSETAPGVSR